MQDPVRLAAGQAGPADDLVSSHRTVAQRPGDLLLLPLLPLDEALGLGDLRGIFRAAAQRARTAARCWPLSIRSWRDGRSSAVVILNRQ